jgi:endonuclease/exonuclease/phosphatase family metal-dependent hydrolase
MKTFIEECMKWIKCICICLLILTGCGRPAPDPALNVQDTPVRLKVMSYNLRYGELASLEELATFIKEQNPDVVALQEVDCRTYRERTPLQHGKDFVTELGFRTGLLTAYGKTIPYANGYYGIGILSKYPLASVERIYLPKTENGKEQRAVLVADVEYREGRYFTFACTHLDYTNTEERQVQVKKLNDVLLPKPYPVIVAGDFNANPGSKEISEGMNGWKQVCSPSSTVPSEIPRKIDYIFCYPQNRWDGIDATVYKIGLSDHFPISAVVDLQ